MDRSDVIILIHEQYETDAMGQRVPVQHSHEVFCNVSSVTGTEWFSGGQNGIRPEYRVTMFAPDYHGEEVVNIGGCIDNCEVSGGINYTVYRTYYRNTDELELYLERRTGS